MLNFLDKIRYFFLPWGLSKGLKPTNKIVTDNPVLEEAYKKSHKGSLNHDQVIGLAKQLDWSERQVQRWYWFPFIVFIILIM